MTLRAICLSAVTAAMLMTTVPTDGQAAVQAGGLTCRSTGSVGYVIGATLNFDCVFMPAADRPRGGPTRLRPMPEGKPSLQPSRCARCDQRDRARRLHP